jgi:surface polysaccharide O-acyltransferase-like enzyme
MKNRETNFEFLRIIAMLFIVIHHLTVNGLNLSEIYDSFMISNKNKYIFLSFIECFTIIGVNVFFLISGYFGIKYNVKKMLKIIMDIYIYSTVIRVIGILLGQTQINFSTIKEIIFPFNTYWFVLAYILLMLISPLLNIITNKIEFKEFIIFLSLVLIIFGIFDFATTNSIISSNNGYSIISAMYLYIIGAGIKKFDNNITSNKYKYLIICSSLLLLNYIVSILGIIILEKGNIVWHLYSYNNILNILGAIYLVRFTKRFEIRIKLLNSIILWVSPSILAVYYLHSSSWLTSLRDYPLKFAMSLNINITYIILPLLIYAIFILIICVIIDKIKRRLLDGYLEIFINYLSKQVYNLVNKYVKYLNKYFI